MDDDDDDTRRQTKIDATWTTLFLRSFRGVDSAQFIMAEKRIALTATIIATTHRDYEIGRERERTVKKGRVQVCSYWYRLFTIIRLCYALESAQVREMEMRKSGGNEKLEQSTQIKTIWSNSDTRLALSSIFMQLRGWLQLLSSH